MKIKGIRKLLCLAFVFAFLLTATRTSINANIDTSVKISPYLSDILNKSDSNEKIPVFIWLEELDLTEAFNDAYLSIGMHEEQFYGTINNHTDITFTDADIDKYINNKRNNVKSIYENKLQLI